jgi:hypothetical protein
MATYENLHGRRVNVVSSNPSNPKEGEVWYNSTLGLLKGYVLSPASVASGGNMTLARSQLGGCGASQNSGLVFGGEAPSVPTITTKTEEYDGTSWSNGGDAPTGKSDMVSVGTQTAALWGGGSPTSSASYLYDGSSWTGTGAMPFSNRDVYSGGAGTSTAGLSIGGFISPGNYSAVMCEFDGSSWTNIPQTFPSAPKTNTFSTAGIQTACISAGPGTDSLEWNGSSWTSTNALATPSSSAVHTGTVSGSVLIAGGPGYQTHIQTWDGTNWSNSPLSISTGRSQAAEAGIATSSIIAGGADGSPTNSAATEEFNGAVVATKTLTTG